MQPSIYSSVEMDSGEPLPWEQTHQPQSRRLHGEDVTSPAATSTWTTDGLIIIVSQCRALFNERDASCENDSFRQRVATITDQLGWWGSRGSFCSDSSIINEPWPLLDYPTFNLQWAVLQFLLLYEKEKHSGIVTLRWMKGLRSKYSSSFPSMTWQCIFSTFSSLMADLQKQTSATDWCCVDFWWDIWIFLICRFSWVFQCVTV